MCTDDALELKFVFGGPSSSCFPAMAVGFQGCFRLSPIVAWAFPYLGLPETQHQSLHSCTSRPKT